jgi:hypothetical protein
MTRTLLAIGVVVVSALPAAAADCFVADPTGTPLNIRMTPNGQTVARARNGTRIQVFDGEDKLDSQGRVWYHVALPTSAAPDGYAFAPYIRCR